VIAEEVESLRRGHLMDEMQIDIEYRRGIVRLRDNHMPVPDFLE
jgi:hypothetical protein